MLIRDEKTGDETVVREVIEAAFKTVPVSRRIEGAIYDALRRAGATTIFLVAEEGGLIVGHIAFSPRDDRRRGLRLVRRRTGRGSSRPSGHRRRPRVGGDGPRPRDEVPGVVLIGDPVFYSRPASPRGRSSP